MSSGINNCFNFRDDGAPWDCMDIIPWGPDEMTNPEDYLIHQHWNNDVGRSLSEGQVNYIYIRTQNTCASQQSTRLHLYAVGGCLFTQPSQWVKLKGANNKNYVEVEAGANSKTVPAAAFQWNVPETTEHYCLVVVASDSDNPVPASFSSTDAYREWVHENHGVAWRNVSLQEAGRPSWQGPLPFGNPDPNTETYAFSVNVTGVDPKVATPTITAQCAESGPNPPIDWTVEGPNLFQETLLPGHFTGILNVSVNLSGHTTWPAGARVLTQYFKVDRPSGGNPPQLMTLGAFTVKG